MLGLPGTTSVEGQRKYAVMVTGDIPGGIESEITQTYLLSEPGTEVRLRKRGINGDYVYFHTIKKTVSDSEVIETERRITPRQYVALLAQADPNRQPIHKTRKNFVWEKQYFELDTYDLPGHGLNILELEGAPDPEQIHFPPFLKVIKDITGDTDYYNYNLALK